uniref:CAMK family protein kinase n=1 Tax=Panagrolaimus sp. PS1159 TaxID=55785 RepID=A0AC35GBA2_9BILA
MRVFGRLSCDFNAVQNDQISAKEGEIVQILDIKDGFATIKKESNQSGKIPNYFLEMVECSEENNQIKIPFVPKLVTFPAVIPTEGPLFPSSQPYIIQDLIDCSFRIGDPIEIHANIGSQYDFALKWNFPNKNRDDAIISAPSDKGHISLFLSNSTIEDRGRYTITLANEHGKTSSSCWIHIVTPPSPPLNLKRAVDPSKPKAIRLKWSPPEDKGGSRLLWYTVQYVRDGLTEWQEVIHGIKQCCIRISHLQNTNYSFRVFAFNEYFKSDPSESVTIDATELELMLEQAKIADLEKKLNVELLKKSFAECFSIEHKIGKGRTGICRQLTCKISGKQFVGKFFPQHSADYEKISREIRILSQIRYSNIPHYFGTALSKDDEIVVITDKIYGQPILNYICNCGYLSEAMMQKFAFDLISAISFIHVRGIAHLGIKPEELLIETTSNLPKLILIDFGSAEEFEGPNAMNTTNLSIWQGGSVEYLAPEQLAHKPCCKSDVWSVGVLLFVLATGISPFEDPDGSDEVSRRRILEGEIADCNDKFRNYSPQLLQLIAQIFVVDHKDRISSIDCLHHTWINEVQSDAFSMVDHIEEYVEKRRDRMRSSFLLHEI